MVSKTKVEKNKKVNDEDLEYNKNPFAWIMNMSSTYPRKTLLVFFIIMMIFLIPASQVTIDSSLEGMFGDELPDEIKQFEEVGNEFGEQEQVTIVVNCSKSNSSNAESFIGELASELEKDEDFSDIRYTTSLDFLGERVLLSLPTENLYFLLDTNTTKESVNSTYQIIKLQLTKESFISSDDKELYLLNMVLAEKIESADKRTEIFDGLYDTLSEVKDSNANYKNLDVGFTGGMAVIDYEGDKMAMNDVALTLIITFILIIILLFVSFRNVSMPLMALVPLLFGIIITMGFVYLIYGALSMMAAFFAVLLLGLGIDFSIHIITRFLEEMQVSNDIKKAFLKTSINTGKAVVLGTLTTATAFGALMFSKTGGMHQMGAVLVIGLIVTMICVLFILPALITLRLRFGRLKDKLHKQAKYKALGSIGGTASKFAVVFVVILIVFGAFVVFESRELKVNENIHELQPKTVPSYKMLEQVKAKFDYSEDSIICVAGSYDELVQSVEGFRALPDVMEVESVLDFLPKNQEEKLAIIQQAKTQNPELAEISWLNIQPLNWSDLPIEIKDNWVSENDGNTKFLIRIKAQEGKDIWDKDFRKDYVKELKTVNPNIVGRAIAFPVLIEAITDDVIWVSIFASIPILIIVYIGFRKKSPVYALLATIPIIVGVGGILSIGKYVGVDLNMISISMIPLVIGIGIDDGIHILHRYKEEGLGSIPKVVQNTGKAIFLTTATTCLAFSSFLVAEHPGMRPMGGVPVLGLTLAFIASIIFLPALIGLFLDRNIRKRNKKNSDEF